MQQRKENKEMPNHVKNIVKMKGITKLPIFTDERGAKSFDFNKIIPMPESLDIEEGSIKSIAIEAALRKLGELRCPFQRGNYYRMDDKEFKQRLHGRNEEELAKKGLLYISNKILYGAATWYDWCCDNWGTKWNSYSNELRDDDTIIFETAWANPEPVMTKLSQMHPEAVIEHWWADEDMGSNDGHRIYRGGEIIEEDHCESCSNEAYEIYIKCWGESACLYQDQNGNWKHHDCDDCHGCD